MVGAGKGTIAARIPVGIKTAGGRIDDTLITRVFVITAIADTGITDTTRGITGDIGIGPIIAATIGAGKINGFKSHKGRRFQAAFIYRNAGALVRNQVSRLSIFEPFI